ncbi:putative copper resistance protein D [Granulicella rosea]|uniref:Putative copper resistance protein D n=1 Tax=Granulicella rosea TaxID=474952 RepID=A0A239LDK3_9BACT|nr:CopD family protein [Granulicella rosea]SNT28022.1 putative copper resistance protein D [Granulicella rosea]
MVDASLALICGLLLALLWLRGGFLSANRLRLPAILLFLAVAAQLLLMVMTMSGASAPHAVMAAMPDVLSTHAGRLTEYILIATSLLAGWTLLPLTSKVKAAGSALLLAVVILLRSATGHAAVDGDWSLAELLQALHLSAMALWSGGVLVSGLLVLPRLVRANAGVALPTPRKYVASLSTVSTWAVAVVALSGVVKAWRQVGGDLHLLRGAGWAWILYAKVACVTLAVLLGGLNRLGLRTPDDWPEAAKTRAARLLRAEAWAMVAVLILSAWLANMPPPGE